MDRGYHFFNFPEFADTAAKASAVMAACMIEVSVKVSLVVSIGPRFTLRGPAEFHEFTNTLAYNLTTRPGSSLIRSDLGKFTTAALVEKVTQICRKFWCSFERKIELSYRPAAA